MLFLNIDKYFISFYKAFFSQYFVLVIFDIISFILRNFEWIWLNGGN